MEFYKLFLKSFFEHLDHLKMFYFKEKLDLLVKNQSWNRTSKRKVIIEHKIWGLKIWLSKKNSAAKCFLICWFPRAYVLGLICLKHILSKVQVKLYNCPIRIEQKPQKCNECCWRVEQLKQTLYIEQRKLGMLYILDVNIWLTNGTFPGRISLTWMSSRTSPSCNEIRD